MPPGKAVIGNSPLTSFCIFDRMLVCNFLQQKRKEKRVINRHLIIDSFKNH